MNKLITEDKSCSKRHLFISGVHNKNVLRLLLLLFFDIMFMSVLFRHFSIVFILASVRVTVDGGTVQWDKFINNLPEDAQKTTKLPDMITGDFDSISNNIMNKYKKKGCKVKLSLFLNLL